MGRKEIFVESFHFDRWKLLKKNNLAKNKYAVFFESRNNNYTSK